MNVYLYIYINAQFAVLTCVAAFARHAFFAPAMRALGTAEAARKRKTYINETANNDIYIYRNIKNSYKDGNTFYIIIYVYSGKDGLQP